MNKLSHGEGLWKALHDKMKKDAHRSIFVMDSESFRLMRLYAELMDGEHAPRYGDVEEGWHTFKKWEFLVRDDVDYIARVKY